MKNLIILVILAFLSLSNLNGQEISITYDYSAVKKLIEIFDKNELLESDFNELVNLNGNKAYLKKLATFFSGINVSSFKRSLEAAAKGDPLENDLFMFERVRKSIPYARKLLTNVMMHEDKLAENSTSLLKQYSPKNIKIEVTVYMILGITGGGWTFDNDPNSFYIDFSSMKDDINGLAYLSAHELFHLIQYRFMKPSPNKSKKVEYLLDQMLREGSATYVADFTKISAPGSYVDFSKKEYEKNFRRMESNFALFENLIFQAKYDPFSKIELLYNIGLSGMYQSPLYYIGYHMIQLVEKYNGREKLIALLKKSPSELILKYNELSIEHENKNTEFIKLSKSTIEILESLNN